MKPRWLPVVVVAVVVTVAQLWLVARAGTDIPFQDQWDAEGAALYPAIQDGAGWWSVALEPHNEHRVFWTQLQNAVLFRVVGRWDPLVQLFVNAIWHGLLAGLVVVVLGDGRTNRGRWWVAGLAAMVMVPVAGWHNALWGFQSQVYFVLGWGVLAVSAASGKSSRAWGALVAAAAGMGAMGPGLLLPGVVLAIWAWRRRCTGEGPSAWGWGAVVVLAVAAIGLALSTTGAGDGAATTVRDALAAAGRWLAWPHAGQPVAALVMVAPLAALLVRTVRRRDAATDTLRLLGLGGWLVVLALGVALKRGGAGEMAVGVPSRYVDFTGLLVVVNGAALAGLMTTLAVTDRRRWLAAAWLFFFVTGWLGETTEAGKRVILPRMADRDAPVRVAQAFLVTDDASAWPEIPRLLVPHPSPPNVRAVLQDPRMEGKLPLSLTPGVEPTGLSWLVRWGLGRQ